MKFVPLLLFLISSFAFAGAAEGEGPLTQEEVKALPCVVARSCLIASYIGSHAYPTQIWKQDPAQSLHLVGAGIQSRKMDESVAIACVGDNGECTRFQFINFVNSQEVYRIGPPFEVRSMQLKGKPLTELQTLREIMSRLAKGRLDRNTRGAYVLLGGIGASVGAAVLFSTIVPGLIVFGAGIYASTSSNGGKIFDFLTPVEKSIRDEGVMLTYTQGWNWSATPKRIKHRSYGFLMAHLLQSFEHHSRPIPWLMIKLDQNMIPVQSRQP